MKDKTISILGCGWLGLPLAEKLRDKGWQVKGSTTSINKLKLLEEKGIEPNLVILNPDVRTENIQKFLDSKLLIIDIPPSRNENVLELFPAQIKSLINEINKSPIEKVIFVSSTSVYGNSNKTVNEESELNPERESGKALVIAEGLLRAGITFATTIIRFGGLIGPERHPGRFLSGRKNIAGGDSKVNLIHQVDCINIILEVIKQNVWGEIFNAVAEEHPTKRKLYTSAAKNLGVQSPTFSDGGKFKIVDVKKIKDKLNYKFQYPNPLEMF